MSIAIIIVLMVLATLIGSVVLIVIARRRGHDYPSCGRCGYDVTASIGDVDRCPECGESFAEAGIIPRGGERKPGLMAVGIAGIVLATGCLGSMGITIFQANRARQQQAQAIRAAAAAAAAAQQQAQAEQKAAQEMAEADAARSAEEAREAREELERIRGESDSGGDASDGW